MRITIVPAGPKTSAATIRRLLQEGPTDVDVYGIYRNLSKVPADFGFHENFHAVYGDVEDASSLDVGGSDAVMTSTPPFLTGEDPFVKAEQVSRNVRDAIERAGGVKRLMLLSSLGAEFEQGVSLMHTKGEIKTNHIAEKILQNTNVPEILFVRCAYFMENWTLFNSQTLKGPEPYFNSVITPLEFQLPMVAVEDIGSTFAAELLSAHAPPSKPYVFALHGPREYSPLDVQVAFSKAMEKQVAVKAIAKDEMADFFSALFPPSLVGIWVEIPSRSATRRAFSSTCARKQDEASAAPAETAPNSRWLSDIRNRLSTGISKRAEEPKVLAQLKHHMSYLDQHWLNLSAGREGYLTEPQWRGLDKHSIAWGDMDSMLISTGHVNNVKYNRFAESGRVNWMMNVAAHVAPEHRREFTELMSPRGIGLILASIRTDYKFPMTFPDQVTVLHKLVTKPDDSSDRILMEAVAYSHKHKRAAARFFEDIAVYDYRAAAKAPLKPFMVKEMQVMYELQEQRRQQTEEKVQEMLQSLEDLEV
ncbi:hypothetical protein NHJ6243_001904 [Beauveria neobassiana]